MRFDIIDGLPYIVISGNAYAVDLSNGNVTIDKSAAVCTGIKGRYTLTEVLAKCWHVSSIKKQEKKQTRKRS